MTALGFQTGGRHEGSLASLQETKTETHAKSKTLFTAYGTYQSKCSKDKDQKMKHKV